LQRRKAFVDTFGRGPGPEDPIFCDLDKGYAGRAVSAAFRSPSSRESGQLEKHVYLKPAITLLLTPWNSEADPTL